MPPDHLYSVYGITFESEFEFPELVHGSGTPDLRVRRGVPGGALAELTRAGTCFEARPDGFFLRVEGVARVWAIAGREIVVDVEAGATESEVRILFLGTVLTAFLHQRKALVMHASGVATSRGVVLLAGHSGDGKSTLLAALAGRGCDPFGDDAAVVTEEATGQPVVHPGFPYARLWADAARRLGHSVDEASRVLPGMDKYWLRLGAQQTCAAQRLIGICILGIHDAGEDVRFDPIVGSERFGVVHAYTRNLPLLECLQMQVPHFRLAASVASHVPVVRMSRPRGRDSLDELLERLEPWLHR